MVQPFFAGRFEAVLCVSWSLLWMVGVVVATLVTPYGWILVALAVLDAALLVIHVAQRIKPPRSQRHVLLRWLTASAQYHAWRFLFGKSRAAN